MATRRTKKADPAPAEVEAPAAAEAPAPEVKKAAAPAMGAADLARFMELKNFDAAQLLAYVQAAQEQADKYIGGYSGEVTHLYKQGVLHLAAKFFAAGTTHIDKPQDIPLVCRHFFELARRELSSSAE